MLTKRYMTSVKNLPAIMKRIQEGLAPEQFTVSHLKDLGFKSSNDRGVIPLLKDLGFLTDDGVPTGRYHEYRDPTKSQIVMAEALKDAYEDLFLISEYPSDNDREMIEGKFKSEHNVSDRVAKEQARTFYALLELAHLEAYNEMEATVEESTQLDATAEVPDFPTQHTDGQAFHHPVMWGNGQSNLRYNIEIHLPPSKDIEVYNAIFKSLRTHLLD